MARGPGAQATLSPRVIHESTQASRKDPLRVDHCTRLTLPHAMRPPPAQFGSLGSAQYESGSAWTISEAPFSSKIRRLPAEPGRSGRRVLGRILGPSATRTHERTNSPHRKSQGPDGQEAVIDGRTPRGVVRTETDCYPCPRTNFTLTAALRPDVPMSNSCSGAGCATVLPARTHERVQERWTPQTVDRRSGDQSASLNL